MITKDQIIEVAKKCFDPEIPVNIWDLGLIYDITLNKDTESVKIQMTLTSRACPAAQQIPNELKSKIASELKVKDVSVELVFDPVWTPERISQEGKKKLGIAENL